MPRFQERLIVIKKGIEELMGEERLRKTNSRRVTSWQVDYERQVWQGDGLAKRQKTRKACWR